MNLTQKPIVVNGDDDLVCSIAVCLLQAGHPVILCTKMIDARDVIDTYLSDQREHPKRLGKPALQIVTALPDVSDCNFAIIVTEEDAVAKTAAIRRVQDAMPGDAVIAINTESIPLSKIQEGVRVPRKIIGVNWSEPAHTTFFLEIVSNETTDPGIADGLLSLATASWKKDPYILTSDVPIRSRMLAAMVREAFFLLENEYVSIEDIDRACRNDAGYYLPFAGHCRYMDLMGTFVYGKVMETLNPELSKETRVPRFFDEIVNSGGEGMKNGKGFYTYDPVDAEQRIAEFRKFSHEIREIISRYPSQLQVEAAPSKKKISSSV